MRAPSERPIQWRCMVFTFSGQSSPSRQASSSSAYLVVWKKYCSSGFWVTGWPVRSSLPSTTCSLASTVPRASHQFTVRLARNTSPRSHIFRNSHWFHR